MCTPPLRLSTLNLNSFENDQDSSTFNEKLFYFLRNCIIFLGFLDTLGVVGFLGFHGFFGFLDMLGFLDFLAWGVCLLILEF